MGAKLRKLTISVLVAGSAALLLAPPAEADRGTPTTTTTTGYVPPPTFGEAPQGIPSEPDPATAPAVVPVELPAVIDPGAGLAGGGDPLGPAPTADPIVLDQTQSRPEAAPSDEGGFIGGILSRTGAETLPLARAGLAAVTLGVGLVMLGRRRRVGEASA
jgi:hypothetical protein